MNFPMADLDVLLTASDLIENCRLRIEVCAALINVGQLHCRPDGQLPAVRNFISDQHSKQRRLSSTVWSNHANNATRRKDEAQAIDQESVAKGFRQALGVNDEITKSRTGRNCDFQLVGTLIAGLGLGY